MLVSALLVVSYLFVLATITLSLYSATSRPTPRPTARAARARLATKRRPNMYKTA